jgi:hypothetical protein
MTAMLEEEIKEERIGAYRVHPVAAMFPLLEGPAYEDFKGKIEAFGLVDPIVVQGDLLIDGRNRLRVCLELGIEPRIEEYSSDLEVYHYILLKNLQRRDLTPDQRATIRSKASTWHKTDRARLRMIEGGKEAGRGRPKKGTTNSSNPIDEPKTRARDARSTVGQIATEANVSHYRATQAVAVTKYAPKEELDAVAAGKQTLNEVYKKIPKKRAPRKPVVKNGAYYTARAIRVIQCCRRDCPPSEFSEFVNQVRKELKSNAEN